MCMTKVPVGLVAGLHDYIYMCTLIAPQLTYDTDIVEII